MAFMVMRERFDQFLIGKSLEEGVELLEGNRVIRVEERGDGFEIELSKGERFRCEYLIGADGPESLVARSFSLRPARKNGSGVALESEIPFESVSEFPKEDLSSIHLDFGGVPNGYGWVFPEERMLIHRNRGHVSRREENEPPQVLQYLHREASLPQEGRTRDAYWVIPCLLFMMKGRRSPGGRSSWSAMQPI